MVSKEVRETHAEFIEKQRQALEKEFRACRKRAKALAKHWDLKGKGKK